jgi:broad specificity phosphatase PhoE
VLLRHGQTRISVEKRFGGTIDVDLTAVGRAQAQAAAERLRGEYFDAIVVSPLKRARQTAAALAGDLDPAVEVIIDEGLRETDFGVFEGRTFAEARESHPDEFAAWRADVAVPPPGGESLLATTERVRETVAKHVAARPGERLLFVTHMGPIKAATALALGVGPGVFYRLHLDLASLTTITWYGDSTAVLHGFNDVRHLPPGALAGE